MPNEVIADIFKYNNHVLAPFIKEILTQGGDSNFLILSLSDDYYIQIAAEIDSPKIVVESVSNKFLSENNKLNNDQLNAIQSLEWKGLDEEDGNYYRNITLTNKQELDNLIKLIDRTAKEVYGVDSINAYMVEVNLQ